LVKKKLICADNKDGEGDSAAAIATRRDVNAILGRLPSIGHLLSAADFYISIDTSESTEQDMIDEEIVLTSTLSSIAIASLTYIMCNVMMLI